MNTGEVCSGCKKSPHFCDILISARFLRLELLFYPGGGVVEPQILNERIFIALRPSWSPPFLS